MGLSIRIVRYLVVWVTCACQRPVLVGDDTPQDTGAPAERVQLPPASDLQILARMSLDTRGVRPTLAEIEAVQNDVANLEIYAAEYTQDPRFANQMAWLWNDTLHTGVFGDSFYRFDGWVDADWRVVGLEPLKIIERIIEEERPFTALVTAEQTQMDGDLADVWGIDSDLEPGEWEWVSYLDGRPMAGLLSSNTLWLRYAADAVNYNRTRANTVARIFLCSDFLDREASFQFDIEAESLTSVEDAVTSEPACLTCHAALDPLASFFGGFAERSAELPVDELVVYSHHNADWSAARRAPAYYGQPATDLYDLGLLVAADPRFARCSVSRFYQGLVGEELADLTQMTTIVSDFESNGFLVGPLVQQIMATEKYRSDRSRLLSSEKLYSVMVDLLGWGSEPLDMSAGLEPLMWSIEHRMLGGGTDDWTVLERNGSHTVGSHLLTAWIGRVVVQAVAADLEEPEGSRTIFLMPGVSGKMEPTEAAVRAQLAALHTRFLTWPVEPDSEEVNHLYELFSAAWLEEGTIGAWAEVVAALIRHPAMGIY